METLLFFLVFTIWRKNVYISKIIGFSLIKKGIIKWSFNLFSFLFFSMFKQPNILSTHLGKNKY
jgi:hypothetical protein